MMAARRFKVGKDFEIDMKIKPTNRSGILVAVGGSEFLSLYMVNGSIMFSTNNGGGPFTAVFKPDGYELTNGSWHDVRAVKAGPKVSLTINEIKGQSVVGASHLYAADTNSPLFIGGHPEADELQFKIDTEQNYAGCMKDIVINGKPFLEPEKLFGEISPCSSK